MATMADLVVVSPSPKSVLFCFFLSSCSFLSQWNPAAIGDWKMDSGSGEGEGESHWESEEEESDSDDGDFAPAVVRDPDIGEKFSKAARSGRVLEVEEILRSDPGLNVNWRDIDGLTALHLACASGHDSIVSILLAHPRIDVNATDDNYYTPFLCVCRSGTISCLRLLLKDSRVDVNAGDIYRSTPLWWASYAGQFDIIRWWIASGREIDLGKPGDEQTDAFVAAKRGNSELIFTLLKEFKKYPAGTRHAIKTELGLVDELAAEVFAIVVFVSDGQLEIRKGRKTTTPAARFLSIANQLPQELQMVLCYRLVGSGKELIQGKDSEAAFVGLAKSLHDAARTTPSLLASLFQRMASAF